MSGGGWGGFRGATRDSWQRITLESLPMLTFTLVIHIIAGQFLLHLEDILAVLPGVLAVLPIIHGVAGNVGTTFSARLGSNLHVGLVRPEATDPEMRRELWNSLLLGAVSFLVVGVVVGLVLPLTGLASPGELDEVLLVYGLSGALAVVYASFSSVVVAFVSFRRGLDPDNFAAPIVTTTTDLVGTIVIFLVVRGWVVG